MANELAEYVKRLLKEGYDEATIKAHLIASGYSPQSIAAIISRITRKSRPKTFLFLIIGVAILSAAIATFFLVRAPGKAITLALEPVSVEIAKNEPLVFDARLTNLGKAKGFPIRLRHNVYEPTKKIILASGEEEFLLFEKESREIAVTLPKDVAPSRYVLEAEASFDSKVVRSNFFFRLVEPVVELPTQLQPPTAPAALACPESCDDKNICTKDSCVQGKCVHKELTPCCGNGICEESETSITCALDCAALPAARTPQEIVDEAKSIVKTNPDEAAALCDGIPQQSFSDDCFGAIALDAANTTFCAKISAEDKRDRCYLSFALERNDFSICSSISNTYLRRSCNSLKNLRALQLSQVQ